MVSTYSARLTDDSKVIKLFFSVTLSKKNLGGPMNTNECSGDALLKVKESE
jgi:hypothetical protein